MTLAGQTQNASIAEIEAEAPRENRTPLSVENDVKEMPLNKNENPIAKESALEALTPNTISTSANEARVFFNAEASHRAFFPVSAVITFAGGATKQDATRRG